MKAILISITFCLLHVEVYSQEISKKAQAYFDQTTEHLTWDRFEEAEALLLKAIELEPMFGAAYQRLGFVYMKQKQYEKSYQVLKKTTELDKGNSAETIFQLSKMAFATQRFEECGILLDKYLVRVKPEGARKAEIEILKRNLAYTKTAIGNKFEFTPVMLNEKINTKDKEYYPSLTADESLLYFTRQFKNEFGKTEEDIFFSKWQDGDWSVPLTVRGEINSYFNEGAHSISADGKKLFFTKCEHEGGYGGCDIYISRKEGNRWTQPENIGKPINSPHKETQPCLSADGTRLYFVSSREGGYGKLDIWYCDLEPDGSWGKAVNAGPVINTPGIDERPYIHPDGVTLYFSSDGHAGYGSADIFMSRKQEEGWGTPVNLGYPINTYEYEGGIFVTIDGHRAYYGMGSFQNLKDVNIMTFEMPDAVKPLASVYVNGYVYDATSNKRISATIEIIDPDNGEIIYRGKADPYDAGYLLCLPAGRRYACSISQPGYLFSSLHFDLVQDSKNYTLNIPLKRLEQGQTIILNNIFFETNASTLTGASTTEIDKAFEFLQTNATIKIEIGGHTDASGDSAYNMVLSEQRAKAVYEALIKKGIAAQRLSYKGYGNSQPIGDNNTPEGRQMNRRTEFKVISVNM